MGLEDSKKREGYSAAIPFTKRAKIALGVSAILLLLGAFWLGRKGLSSLEGRIVRGAEISLLSDDPIEAKSQLERVWRWALKGSIKRKFDVLTLQLEAVESPSQGLRKYREYLESTDWKKNDLEQYTTLLLRAMSVAVKAQDWDYVRESVVEIEERFPKRLLDARLIALKAWVALQGNQSKEGYALIQSSLDINPFDKEALMLRSRFQANSASEVEKNQARFTLKKIAAESGVESLEALLLLIVGKDLLLYPEDWDFALRKLNSHPFESIHFSLQNTGLLRQLAAILVHHDLDLCIKYLERLVGKSDAVAQDWVRLAYALQRNGEIEEASGMIAQAESMKANPDLLLWLKGRQAYLMKDWELALRLLTEGANGSIANSFYETMIDFLNNESGGVPQEIRSKAASRLRRWTEAGLEEWILVRQRLWSWDESTHRSIIDECIEKAKVGNPIRIARFLLSMEEPSSALTIVDNRNIDDQLSYGVRFIAFLQLEQFEEARMLIESAEKIEDFTLELSKLQLAFEMNDDFAMERAWTACLTFSEAEGISGDGYLRMAKLAIEYDQALLAEAVFSRQFLKDEDKRGGTSTLWMEYLRIALKHGQTEKALKVAYFIDEGFPGNDEVTFKIAYLNLLLQRGILTAKDSIRELLANDPEHAPYNHGMAMALLRTELGGEAAEWIESLDTEVDSEYVTLMRIVEYAVLVETMKLDDAVAYRKKIDLDALLPEEAAFVLKYEKRLRERF
ncbi:hypothetical protein MLD52_13590 [Puniceicoccaceae bacterium K14]|nr:hypothetical protein [Puniceicoccaceae bacterium K14]